MRLQLAISGTEYSQLDAGEADGDFDTQVSLPLTMCTLAARLLALTFILAFQVKQQLRC